MIRTLVLNVADLELVEQWLQDYEAALASDSLGGGMTSVEQQLAHHIRKALHAKVAWEITELDVGWLLEWAERSTDPSRSGSQTVFGHEADLIDKLSLLT